MRRMWRLPLTAAVLLLAGCSFGLRKQPPQVASPPAPAVTPTTPILKDLARPADPVEVLISTSEQHFQRGEQELRLGHLDRARAEFDRAVEMLLQSPEGARGDSRLRAHFERLIDRINTYEAAALAEGDGFNEKGYVPASRDELFAISMFYHPEPTVAVANTVQADLKTTEHDLPIPSHPRVLSFVELFQGRLHDFVEEGLRRGSRYLPMIQAIFRAEGLPLDLAYIPLVESAFKPNALSRAKAKGVWQFMRGTALEHGLKADWYVDERSDPEKATRAAAKYLRQLYRMFDGDWHKVLAAYNGGPGRLQRAIDRSGRGDFWRLAESRRFLPRETRDYVPMILAAILIARNPLQYGFDFDPEAELAYEKVTVKGPIDLRRVAEWTSSSIDEIQALNPELRRWTTPLKSPEFELKVPVGSAEALKDQLAATSPGELNTLRWYRVKRGESLSSIARKLGVSRSDLAAANSLSVKARVRPGEALVIPRDPAVALAARPPRSAAGEKPMPLASRDLASGASSAAVRVPSEPPKHQTTYRVRRGDTLYSIARAFGTTIESLRALNRLTSTKLIPGSRLMIRASK